MITKTKTLYWNVWRRQPRFSDFVFRKTPFKFDFETRKEIYRKYSQGGISAQQLADEYNCCYSTILKIINAGKYGKKFEDAVEDVVSSADCKSAPSGQLGSIPNASTITKGDNEEK